MTKCRVHCVLQPHSGGSLARPQGVLKLSFFRSCTAHFLARGDHAQPELSFQAAHDGLLSLVVVGVAYNLAVECDPIHQDVDVRMSRIGMAADDILIVHESHALHPGVGNFSPLVVGKTFVRMDANAHMTDCSPDSRAQGADSPEFGRKRARSCPGHVAFQHDAFAGLEIILDRSPKSSPFDELGDHGSSPNKARWSWMISLRTPRRRVGETTARPSFAARASWLMFTASRVNSP